MKYGKLDDITGIDFSLPADHPDTGITLAGRCIIPDIRLGGTMWNIPSWIGKVYPPGTRQKDFLKAYATVFNTIELNATHYRSPTIDTVKGWAAQVPGGFMFCPKFPQSISHYRRFRDCREITDLFLEAIWNFGPSLGPAFIQLPEHIGPSVAGVLIDYLRSLPSDMHFALELRHPDWFRPLSASEEVWDLLRERKITSIISDTAGRRDAVHMRLTSPDLVLRFGGNNLHETDYQRLNAWIERIAGWAECGLESVQLWMHQPDSVVTPETLHWFSASLKKRTGWPVADIPFVQNTLF